MKKILKLSLVAAVMVTLTIQVVEKQSSLSGNPLLSANVEALSASEVVDQGVIDTGNGTILFKNAINVKNNAGRSLNHCEPLTGAVCNIKTSCNANGRITLDTVLDFVKSFFSVDKVEVLLEFAKQLISNLSL